MTTRGRSLLPILVACVLGAGVAHAGKPAAPRRADVRLGRRLVTTDRPKRALPRQRGVPSIIKVAAAKPTARPRQSRRQREARAIRAVQQALARWQRPGETREIRAAVVPFNGDARNPITGAGPIEVIVTSEPGGAPSAWQRLRRAFDPGAQRKFLVSVDTWGEASILAEEPGDVLHRLSRAITTHLPVRELLSDVLHSRGVRNGALTATLGGLAAPVSPLATAIGLVRGLQLASDGIKRRQEGRTAALGETVQWAKEGGRKGDYPTLTEAYRHYQMTLEKVKPGTTPVSTREFAEQLSMHGL